jgi:hypothetical protein
MELGMLSEMDEDPAEMKEDLVEMKEDPAEMKEDHAKVEAQLKKIFRIAVQHITGMEVPHAIAKTFATMLSNQEATHYTRYHCELVLASVLRYHKDALEAISNSDFHDILQV